jgi:alcohol dehydrogenase class IV
MSLGSLYAGLCLGPVNTAAVHALAYPLGGTFDVPHGVANSLLLPYVTEFNLSSHLTRYAGVAQALGEATSGLPVQDAAALCVPALTRLAEDVGIVSRMRELGIPEDAIDSMAEAAMKVTRLLNNNPRTMTMEDARGIYRNAW